MNEKQIREAVRSALRKLGNSKVFEEKSLKKEEEKESCDEAVVDSLESLEEKENFVPKEKEHLFDNKMNLNKELMSRWVSKKGK